MKVAFSKHDIFPIIGSIIDDKLSSIDSINRDEITNSLLAHPKGEKIVAQAFGKYKTDDIFNVSGNMVDWFSAELTRQSNIALPWVNKYFRKRIKIKGREVWQYSLKEESFPDEITEELSGQLVEGAKRTITVNIYERNPKARIECIKTHGTTCTYCGFDFYKKYGDIGQGFIHVHHIKPISEIKAEYEVNPKIDLRPVCPNCHAMIHRKNPPFTIDDIKEMITKNKLAR